MPASNLAQLAYPFQVPSGQQSLLHEVGTPGRIKHDALQPSCGQEAPFADNIRKRRKIITIDLRDSDHDKGALFEFTGSFIRLIFVVTDYLPARRDEEVSLNDGRDV